MPQTSVWNVYRYGTPVIPARHFRYIRATVRSRLSTAEPHAQSRLNLCFVVALVQDYLRVLRFPITNPLKTEFLLNSI
jgi:hypothetical protein